MNGFLSLPTWSPYIVGVGIGLLVCLALVVSDRPIGCSTAFVKATGLIEQTHSREERAGERILQEISPTHRLAIHHCARHCHRCIHLLLPFRHIRFLHRSATLGCTVRRLSGTPDPRSHRRGNPPRVWGTVGRRLHKRAWNQWNTATLGREHSLGRLFLCGRDSHGNGPLRNPVVRRGKHMDLTQLHKNGKAQVLLGLLFGIVFGFLLQKGGATSYEVIIGQLLLTDFTVLKIMASAVATGLVGFFLLRHYGYAKRHVKAATIGSNVVGGLIFGLGFGLLGYCPGTVAGAVGSGALDALFGGVVGLLIGAGIFAWAYPSLDMNRFFKNFTSRYSIMCISGMHSHL